MSWNTPKNCFWIISENPYKILWGCRTCVGRAKAVVTNHNCSDFSLLAMVRSEIRTAETHECYDYNSSHVRSQSFATQQWQPAVNQIQSSQRWVKPNQRRVPNQCSNIRSFSGPSLSAHAKPDRPRHPKPRVLARRDFYFRSARIVVITHRSANDKESAGRLGSRGFARSAFLTLNFTNLTFLEAVGTCYQTGVLFF